MELLDELSDGSFGQREASFAGWHLIAHACRIVEHDDDGHGRAVMPTEDCVFTPDEWSCPDQCQKENDTGAQRQERAILKSTAPFGDMVRCGNESCRREGYLVGAAAAQQMGQERNQHEHANQQCKRDDETHDRAAPTRSTMLRTVSTGLCRVSTVNSRPPRSASRSRTCSVSRASSAR